MAAPRGASHAPDVQAEFRPGRLAPATFFAAAGATAALFALVWLGGAGTRNPPVAASVAVLLCGFLVAAGVGTRRAVIRLTPAGMLVRRALRRDLAVGWHELAGIVVRERATRPQRLATAAAASVGGTIGVAAVHAFLETRPQRSGPPLRAPRVLRLHVYTRPSSLKVDVAHLRVQEGLRLLAALEARGLPLARARTDQAEWIRHHAAAGPRSSQA